MGANGKGNGKKGGGGAAPAPAQGSGNGKNGKGAHAPSTAAPPDEGREAERERADEPGPAGSEAASAAARAEASPPEADPAPAGPAGGEKGAGVPASAHADVPRGAAWGHPLVRLEARWTWLESRLLTFVLVWQILVLTGWIVLRGLSASVGTPIGAVIRILVLGAAAGFATWRATRDRSDERRRTLVLLGISLVAELVLFWRYLVTGTVGALVLPVAGALGLVAWVLTRKAPEERRRDLPVVSAVLALVLVLRLTALVTARSVDRPVYEYFDNVKGWLQEGSTLTLLGGLRGLGTRLTLWLALLGGSMATASGKHIHVDVVFRFLPRKLRVPVTILNYCFAASVCFAGVWGFFDHIAIEAYGSRADDRAGAKIENAVHHFGNHMFFTRKQIGLDLRSLPRVLAGKRYDQWMTADAWNEWVDGAGYESRWEADKAKALRIPDGTHPPFVVSPDGETTRGALAHTLGLVFPFGLLAIGLRFLLRALLVLSGHYEVDPDEAHKEEIGQGHDAAREGGV